MYQVRPTDPDRRAQWLDAVGRDTLPVSDGRARTGLDGSLVYDVDMARLTASERFRLTGFAGVPHAGVVISAVGCELLLGDETARGGW